ncbi:thiamine phosphate synthase [Jeotgalibacillus proteolyticus]|uniref:Thiamine-phosphate synthase n=1 Tax=Jeotgalibacillus proteolyticus TaxID=2082395 RepID=A0A2S5G8D8_9BACL|nr:thiamine phosphate synthase [Jeotgalibacillus proteolyticus]PPA69250.1 thiamine phosphate synthase [Jeotgalibacillus proteolyticus]
MSWNVNQLLRKYLIMGSQNCPRDPEDILLEAIEGGITAFQFREKGDGALTGEQKIKLGLKLRQICREHSIPFFINDDSELIEELDADGIHVGQDDIPADLLRRQYPDKIIGLSVSSDAELEQSDLSAVDYVGAGPVFFTWTKDDVKPVVGVEWIEKLRARYPDLPIVGIGGINSDNAREVIEAGAQGVAVISAVTNSTAIKETIKDL